jgi:hypothetical protein
MDDKLVIDGRMNPIKLPKATRFGHPMDANFRSCAAVRFWLQQRKR